MYIFPIYCSQKHHIWVLELENYSLQNLLVWGENGVGHSTESLFYLIIILMVEMMHWELRTRNREVNEESQSLPAEPSSESPIYGLIHGSVRSHDLGCLHTG